MSNDLIKSIRRKLPEVSVEVDVDLSYSLDDDEIQKIIDIIREEESISTTNTNDISDIDERVLDYYEELKLDINYQRYSRKELFTKAVNHFYS